MTHPLTSKEVRLKFLRFFEARGHKVLPSSSLVPQDDPTVLFNTAGMQPLTPYLMGAKHPEGDRLVNVQKCVRTTDIDDIGDNTHATFFEMLGNWSLGNYFKEDAIKWSYEFLTLSDEGLGLDPKRLYVTVYAGDDRTSRDEESASIWMSLGVSKERIYFRDASNNWWPAVKGKDSWTGPSGPCSEMFYDITPECLGDLTSEEFERADEEKKVVEIWNDVFMEYEKRDGSIIGKLSQRNVDTGAGLERLLMVTQGKESIFDTDILTPLMKEVSSMADDQRRARIIADHMRTAIFLISDGVVPSNKDRGYVLRRLIRRAVYSSRERTITQKETEAILKVIMETYGDEYSSLVGRGEEILEVITKEVDVFKKTLASGLRELEKTTSSTHEISPEQYFRISSTFGLPVDIIVEEARKQGKTVDIEGFEREVEKHRELSTAGSTKRFKGGLSDTSEMSVKYHTATHLLGAALRQILGQKAIQKGSNITSERLRFDFAHVSKLSSDEIKEIEELVNTKIRESLPVGSEEMSLADARAIGTIGVFGEKYADTVRVYTIGSGDQVFSREICGGPHVKNTSELRKFRIIKEEAVSQGVRRIKAVLE